MRRSRLRGNHISSGEGNLACSGNSPAVQLGDSDGSPNLVAGNATGECGFNVMLPNPGPNSGVQVPPTYQPASVKLHP